MPPVSLGCRRSISRRTARGENLMPLVTPSETVAVLERHGLHLSSELGQNFLVDANVLKKIIAAAELAPGDVVVEVGGGGGALDFARGSGRRGGHRLLS